MALETLKELMGITADIAAVANTTFEYGGATYPLLAVRTVEDEWIMHSNYPDEAINDDVKRVMFDAAFTDIVMRIAQRWGCDIIDPTD